VDLEVLFVWSRERNPRTTEQFASDLFNHLDLLKEFPFVGTPIKKEPNVRRLLHSPVYVYYRIDERREGVEILHFWHTSRQPPRF
jgi:plasmid stabilization system protein ParE